GGRLPRRTRRSGARRRPGGAGYPIVGREGTGAAGRQTEEAPAAMLV
ncbi:MAG: hypothetical protein AVDCRST_MAG73-1237, partial [uncultured Thermomicrobiales bacterium]